MTIQSCHHYLAKKKWMQWILVISQMMNLGIWICYKTFMMEVNLILTLIGEKQAIKYVIVLNKDNHNGKES